MAYSFLIRSKHTAEKLELPAVSKSWVNSGFVAGQQLSGSLVPEPRVD
jgi:hypothetical protein